MSNRNQKDGALLVTRALPATGATVTSSAINLDGETLGATAECVEAVISVPATTTLVDAKTITISLEDSADNSAFSSLTGAGSAVVTGKTGNGSDAVEVHLKLPTTTRRYLRATATAATASGDSTGTNFELSIRA